MCYTRPHEMNIGPNVFAYSVYSFDYLTIRDLPGTLLALAGLMPKEKQPLSGRSWDLLGT